MYTLSYILHTQCTSTKFGPLSPLYPGRFKEVVYVKYNVHGMEYNIESKANTKFNQILLVPIKKLIKNNDCARVCFDLNFKLILGQQCQKTFI